MNPYLEKIAKQLSEQTKNDMVNTGVLGVIGGAEAMGMSHLYKTKPIAGLSGKAKFGLGVGVTLGADYLGVKLGNGLNRLRGSKPPETHADSL